jgi:NTE family protein
MIAFVLSGGGNRGAIEAGALLALFEHGIRPDILVGTSAGAMNAAFIALNPTLDGAKALVDKWKTIKKETIFPGNILTQAWRFITGADSISTNDSLRAYLDSQLPPGVRTFGDLPKSIRLYTTTSNLNTADIYLFGDDPGAILVDAVLASAAVPPILPPIDFGGWQFVDGAACADVPITIAVDKGATDIYTIDVGTGALPGKGYHGVIPIALRVINVLGHQQLLRDFEDVMRNTNVKLHYLLIPSYPDIGDFDHAQLFADEGYRFMNQFLDGQTPVPEGMPVTTLAAPAPPGAVKWERRRL